MRYNLLDILRLYRIHTAMVTASVPGIAAYLAGGGPFLISGVVIGSIFHHAWGFSLNEIIDLDVDRRNPELSFKPLVSGKISRSSAHFLSLVSLFLAFSFFAGGVILEGGELIPVLVLLGLATLSGGIYDLWGKKFPLSDIFVALWIGLLILSAGSSASEFGPYDVSIWAIAILGTLHILFNNSVEGGLKDVENDLSSGARTFAVISGTRRKKNELSIPLVFRSWGLFLRTGFIISASVFSLLISEQNDWGPWIVIVVSIWGVFLFWHALGFLQPVSNLHRAELIKTFSRHELLSFSLSLLVIMPAAGIIPVLITLTIPVIWTVALNRILFSTGLAPKA